MYYLKYFIVDCACIGELGNIIGQKEYPFSTDGAAPRQPVRIKNGPTSFPMPALFFVAKRLVLVEVVATVTARAAGVDHEARSLSGHGEATAVDTRTLGQLNL